MAPPASYAAVMRIVRAVLFAAVVPGALALSYLAGAPGVQASRDDTARGAQAPADDARLRGTLVFQSDRDGRPGIYTIDLASRRVARLSGSPQWSETTPRWSPDGRWVAFASNRAHHQGASPERGTPDVDLYLIRADGTGLRRVTTSPGNDNDPSWVPDGKSLYYWSDADSRGDISRVWLDTGRVERLTRQFVGRAIMPNASPDGRRVAFAAQTLRLGQFWAYQLHMLDVARGTTEALDDSSGACWPAFSRDATRLAHVRLTDGRPSSIVIRTLSTGATDAVVADASTWSYYPAWSPDGRHLAFSTSPAHHDGEDWDLAVVDVGSRGVTRLTSGPGNDRLPDWKP